MRFDVFFLLLAGVLLVVGVALGLVMGSTHDFQLAPIHAHINLVGWASLAIFGLTYRAFPQLSTGTLPKVHFGFSSVGALLFPIGLYLAIFRDAPGLAIGSSMLWLAGAIAFLAQLVRLLRS